ncbi:MAG: hypothetical protein A3J38_01840 [Gammaproteobacteria bacterium RIFCSPHIGHO2_12_FULL_45_9]|nr:MAG: hypothetical protein A3J38_01840 [Gammaproteobacteria bacterium RIFCSPHIGHO2_12_FULL_45_9]
MQEIEQRIIHDLQRATTATHDIRTQQLTALIQQYNRDICTLRAEMLETHNVSLAHTPVHDPIPFLRATITFIQTIIIHPITWPTHHDRIEWFNALSQHIAIASNRAHSALRIAQAQDSEALIQMQARITAYATAETALTEMQQEIQQAIWIQLLQFIERQKTKPNGLSITVELVRCGLQSTLETRFILSTLLHSAEGPFLLEAQQGILLAHCLGYLIPELTTLNEMLSAEARRQLGTCLSNTIRSLTETRNNPATTPAKQRTVSHIHAILNDFSMDALTQHIHYIPQSTGARRTLPAIDFTILTFSIPEHAMLTTLLGTTYLVNLLIAHPTYFYFSPEQYYPDFFKEPDDFWYCLSHATLRASLQQQTQDTALQTLIQRWLKYTCKQLDQSQQFLAFTEHASLLSSLWKPSELEKILGYDRYKIFLTSACLSLLQKKSITLTEIQLAQRYPSRIKMYFQEAILKITNQMIHSPTLLSAAQYWTEQRHVQTQLIEAHVMTQDAQTDMPHNPYQLAFQWVQVHTETHDYAELDNQLQTLCTDNEERYLCYAWHVAHAPDAPFSHYLTTTYSDHIPRGFLHSESLWIKDSSYTGYNYWAKQSILHYAQDLMNTSTDDSRDMIRLLWEQEKRLNQHHPKRTPQTLFIFAITHPTITHHSRWISLISAFIHALHQDNTDIALAILTALDTEEEKITFTIELTKRLPDLITCSKQLVTLLQTTAASQKLNCVATLHDHLSTLIDPKDLSVILRAFNHREHTELLHILAPHLATLIPQHYHLASVFNALSKETCLHLMTLIETHVRTLITDGDRLVSLFIMTHAFMYPPDVLALLKIPPTALIHTNKQLARVLRVTSPIDWMDFPTDWIYFREVFTRRITKMCDLCKLLQELSHYRPYNNSLWQDTRFTLLSAFATHVPTLIVTLTDLMQLLDEFPLSERVILLQTLKPTLHWLITQNPLTLSIILNQLPATDQPMLIRIIESKTQPILDDHNPELDDHTPEYKP